VVRRQPGSFRGLEGVAQLIVVVSGEIFQLAGVDQLVQALGVDDVEDSAEGGDAGLTLGAIIRIFLRNYSGHNARPTNSAV
jgi:hypothetical protein